ncbi:hypothetical protein [Oryzifoliimicrobium ureilyticus]|uniref:hypothetical protein n=1 Tax=Oryzifoliimicrobium ureilyticus TaxID=3113724 RepID=UPI00307655D1
MWQVDGIGRLRLSGVHDSNLSFFSYDIDAHRLLLRFRNGNLLSRFQADGVRRLNIEALWEGTIIDTIWLWRHAPDGPAPGDQPDLGWQHLFQGQIGKSEFGSERKRLEAISPAGVLSTIACSYGGQISFFADHVKIEQTLMGEAQQSG